MIFDSDVLVWYLRGNPKAIQLVDETYRRITSVVSGMELLQGAFNLREAKEIKDFLVEFSFEVLPLTENIGHRALIYIEEYSLRTGLYLGDALIAATAVENRLTLCTANQKHYKSIAELDLKIFHP